MLILFWFFYIQFYTENVNEHFQMENLLGKKKKKKRASAEPQMDYLVCMLSTCTLVHMVGVKCLGGCCCLEATVSLKVK